MRPESEEALAEAIRAANGPLSVRGGGTRGIGVEGEPLETGGLSGITLYEPGALTLVAKAGTPVAEIEAALAAEGQRLAFEPPAGAGSTIGGVVATNASGPRRIAVGAARDFCLGVRFVDGAGRVLKNGGRVMKNVTGYDLVKLMAGSHGTLGVLSEVSLKVLPQPETAANVVIRGLPDARAVEAMSAALGSPFEVTGASHWSEGAWGGSVTTLRVEGFADSVAYRAGRLRDLLAGFGEIAIIDTPDAVEATWTATRDVTPLREGGRDLWRLSTRPSAAAGLVAGLPRSLFDGTAPGAIYDWGGGLVWLAVTPGTDLRAHLGRFDGHATQVRGHGAPRFPPEAPAVAALTRGLRARFDPRGILNPGLMEA